MKTCNNAYGLGISTAVRQGFKLLPDCGVTLIKVDRDTS